jgi:hypothetical protein
MDRENKEKALVVTTLHRGVFFGYGEITEAKTIKLNNVRMCVSWPVENHGMVGLAANGPSSGSRVSPAAPSVLLQDVTAIFEPSPDAIERWESEIWQK